MKSNNQILHSAYILHARPFRETSLLLDVFTKENGRVQLIAKGAKRIKSAFRGLLQPFLLLEITFGGRSELRTLFKVEQAQTYNYLAKQNIIYGLYLNELLVKLLPKQDAHPELFEEYQKALFALQQTENSCEIVLRKFEWQLLKHLGYELNLSHTIEDNQDILDHERYHYYYGKGFVTIKHEHETSSFAFSGKNLLAIQQQEFSNEKILYEAKVLFRYVIQNLLNQQEIVSRELLVS